MKEKVNKKHIFSEQTAQKKPLLYAVLAAGSFLVMLLLCMRLKRDGVVFLICMILHTCSLLLLYRDALIAIDPEDWKTEEEWMQEDLPPEEDTEDADEAEPAEVAVPYNKTIYAELQQSLIAAPCSNAAEDTICADEEILPADTPQDDADTEIPPADTPQDDAEATEEETPSAPAEKAPQGLTALFSAPKKPVEMDLIAAAKDAMNSLSSFADAQKIKLHLSAPCDSLLMYADPESIRVLFRNIIDNSIKYMGRPGHMIITISRLGDDIFLILKDTGNGLAAEETQHIFELNFQGSNRVSGNGLGLTQTKMIVEAFGGTIYAKSNPGEGMAIYIQLPLAGGTQLA